MTVPSSGEVYELLSTALDPILRQANMDHLRGLSYPAWRGPCGGSADSCFFSLHVDSKATDPFAGGGFRIELERSKQAIPARGLNGRALFFQLLNDRELSVLLSQQNKIIESLPQPPDGQITVYPAGPVRRQYLNYFEPQQKFDAVESWLRYRFAADVLTWANLLGPLVEPLLARASTVLQPDVLHLGAGYLLPT
jgi:hypothetical protein